MYNKFLTTIFLIFICTISFAQKKSAQPTDTKTIINFEKYIISGQYPPSSDAEIKYEQDYRAIVWNDPLIKSYKYSNQQFDILGYEFIGEKKGDRYQKNITYRNCEKNIVVEITEWYGTKLSISMQWYSQSVKNQIGYLMYCANNIAENSAAAVSDEIREKSEKENKIRKKIQQSSYVYGFEILNGNDLKMSFDDRSLNVLYDYFNDFKVSHPFSYDKKMEYYYNNKSEGRKSDDYSMYTLSLFFDKSGTLQKVTNDDVLIKGEGTTKLNLDEKWLTQLQNLIRLNKPAIVNLDGNDNVVNSYFICFFTPNENYDYRKIEFSKSKKGVLSINSTESKDLQLLNGSEIVKSLLKGKYIATITTTTLKLSLFHFHNYGKQERILVGKQIKEDISIEPIEK